MSLARLVTAVDAAANLGGGTISLLAPVVWRTLGLPEQARRSAGLALLAGGAWHAAGAVDEPGPTHLRVAAAVNAGWVAAGLSAQRLALAPWQRIAVAVVAAYDTSMCLVKLQQAQAAS